MHGLLRCIVPFSKFKRCHYNPLYWSMWLSTVVCFSDNWIKSLFRYRRSWRTICCLFCGIFDTGTMISQLALQPSSWRTMDKRSNYVASSPGSSLGLTNRKKSAYTSGDKARTSGDRRLEIGNPSTILETCFPEYSCLLTRFCLSANIINYTYNIIVFAFDCLLPAFSMVKPIDTIPSCQNHVPLIASLRWKK